MAARLSSHDRICLLIGVVVWHLVGHRIAALSRVHAAANHEGFGARSVSKHDEFETVIPEASTPSAAILSEIED